MAKARRKALAAHVETVGGKQVTFVRGSDLLKMNFFGQRLTNFDRSYKFAKEQGYHYFVAPIGREIDNSWQDGWGVFDVRITKKQSFTDVFMVDDPVYISIQEEAAIMYAVMKGVS